MSFGISGHDLRTARERIVPSMFSWKHERDSLSTITIEHATNIGLLDLGAGSWRERELFVVAFMRRYSSGAFLFFSGVGELRGMSIESNSLDFSCTREESF